MPTVPSIRPVTTTAPDGTVITTRLEWHSQWLSCVRVGTDTNGRMLQHNTPSTLPRDRHGRVTRIPMTQNYTPHIDSRDIRRFCRDGRWDASTLDHLLEGALSTNTEHRNSSGERRRYESARLAAWLNRNTTGQSFEVCRLNNSRIFPSSDMTEITTEIEGITGLPAGERVSRQGLESHIFTCQHCQRQGARHSAISARTNRGRTRIIICRECASEHFREDDSGDQIPLSEWTPAIPTRILDYNANPMRHLAGFQLAPKEHKNPHTVWFGVELEVKPRNERRSDLDDCFKSFRDSAGTFAIAKYDGSVPGGMEICTVPGTLAFHQNAWDRFFADTAPLLRGYTADECGMHVHISKTALSYLARGRLMAFINGDANAPFINQIAGRGPNRWCSRSLKEIKLGKTEGTDHYEAVSLSQHTRKTVEIRIFRSNVARLGFFKNLEFVAAAVQFVNATSNNDLDVPSFCRFACEQDRIGQWPNLATWLERHGYIVTNRRPAPYTAAPAESN